MSTNKLLSTSLFCLHFFSCCGQVYKTRTNSIFYKSSFSLILCYFPQHCLYFFPEPHIQYIQYYAIYIVLYVFLGITRSGMIWYIQYIQYYKYYVFTSVCTQIAHIISSAFVSKYIISCFYIYSYYYHHYDKDNLFILCFK